MAGRFRLYTDTDVDGRVVKALSASGWDLLRGIDAHPERTRDHVHFARAAQEGLEGRPFPGLVWWHRRHYARMSPGDFVLAFEELACQDDPFAGYPIVHIKPRR